MASKAKGGRFVTLFMGTLALRMFFCIAFLVLYLIFSRQKDIPFICYYLLLYLFYSAFEIYLLLSNLRADLKNKSIK